MGNSSVVVQKVSLTKVFIVYEDVHQGIGQTPLRVANVPMGSRTWVFIV